MEIDLVAMTTHGRTGLGRLVLGSVAERVLEGRVGTRAADAESPQSRWRMRLPGEELARVSGFRESTYTSQLPLMERRLHSVRSRRRARWRRCWTHA